MTAPASIIEVAIGASAEEFHVDPEAITGRSRTQQVAHARHSAVWVVRQRSSLSYPAIGRAFDRDHTTVLASFRAVEHGPPRLRAAATRVLERVDERRPNHPRTRPGPHARLGLMSAADLHARIDNDFGYHPPSSPEIAAAHEKVREICATAAHGLVDLCPDSRELSLALSSLEDAMYHANAIIARGQTLRSS